ncbi:MAG: diaminopimelate decarboxylase [Firmicutes bacterium]|nr:diaminopimelate decarboxylase [Bacillota bacterium]
MQLPGTERINEAGHLEIGGCDSLLLAERFETPLYVLDETSIREAASRYIHSFEAEGLPFQVLYASKALCTMAVLQIVHDEGCQFDVVSAGEIYTALAAGIEPNALYFHGNNKTAKELRYAIDTHVGHIVIDNLDELTRLQEILRQRETTMRVLLRVTPGVEAHTHEYVQTGQEDSKFGLDLLSGQAMAAAQRANEDPHLILDGLHCHIGSQIFTLASFELAIEKMAAFAARLQTELGIQIPWLNVGGGFGIRYTEEDRPFTPEAYVHAICQATRHAFTSRHMPVPGVMIEPGRAIVGPAGTTLYRVGVRKEIPGIRTYIAVDGGMGDNIRPALYQARYEALLANRAAEVPQERVSIAGRYCESGDMLVYDAFLPKVHVGDLVAITNTGAYTYSMASNYNRVPRPAMVLVKEGQADLIIERERLESLIAFDRVPQRLRSLSAINAVAG